MIVPGVGHFGSTRTLDQAWRHAILERLDAGRPLLGICVGLQWLFAGSTEAPDVPGFGRVPGHVRAAARRRAGDRRASEGAARRLEHAGAAAAVAAVRRHRRRARTSTSRTPTRRRWRGPPWRPPSYGVEFTAAVEDGLVSGVQFHPEKSGQVGLQVLRNWLPGVPLAMLAKRIIACLDVRDGVVVKGVQFEGLREAGDPAALARRYDVEGIDEVVILDVTATLEARQARAHTIHAVARELFLPLCVGGGIRTEDDAAAAIDAGADKVSLNSAALADPSLITRLAERYGSQAVVVAIDAKRVDERLDRLHAQRLGRHGARRRRRGRARRRRAAPARSC